METIHKRSTNGKGFLVSVFLIASFFLTGCAVTPGYEEGQRFQGTAISNRSQWKVYADGLKNPAAAIDDNTGTAAVSEAQYASASITVDLGKPCMLNMVVLDHTKDQFGFCKRVAVLTSMDGENFTHRYATTGSRLATAMLLPAPVLARYIRVQVVIPGAKPWVISEIYIQ